MNVLPFSAPNSRVFSLSLSLSLCLSTRRPKQSRVVKLGEIVCIRLKLLTEEHQRLTLTCPRISFPQLLVKTKLSNLHRMQHLDSMKPCSLFSVETSAEPVVRLDGAQELCGLARPRLGETGCARAFRSPVVCLDSRRYS